MKKVLSTVLASALALPLLGTAADADGNVVAGILKCEKTGSGMSYGVFSHHPAECTYEGAGGAQKYKGTYGILLGIDAEMKQTDMWAFTVLGGTWAKDALAGTYVGAKGSVIAGVGPTVQAGLVGGGNNVTLVPIGIGVGANGLGFSGGLNYLKLDPGAVMVVAPAPAPAPAALTTVKSFTVYFDTNSATLNKAAKKVIDQAVAEQGTVLPAEILVTGHTDTKGTGDFNKQLSNRRAQAVAAALAEKGVVGKVIDVKSEGEAALAIKTGDNVSEAKNRRVEILFRK